MVAGITFAGADTGMLNFLTGLPSSLGEQVAEPPSLDLAAGLPCSGVVAGLLLVELEADLLAAEREVFLPRASLKEACAVGEVGVEGEFTLK